ncbi:hypothetical protein [Leifsonia xyli]|uniref:hypothetical protein n=1 Tax=Leifsonia xyli TaxID=1575 RepID=UPI003D66C56C
MTGGTSLFLTGLGGTLLVGGINNAINHASIAATGQDFNVVGMAGDAAGTWVDANLVKPAAVSGSWGAQFAAGVASGLVHGISQAGHADVPASRQRSPRGHHEAGASKSPMPHADGRFGLLVRDVGGFASP